MAHRFTDTQHSNALHYAECCILFIAMLSVVMLNIVILSVIMLNIITMNVNMLNVVVPKSVLFY
jgi:hypothetical protein